MAEAIDWVSALAALGVAELVRGDIVRTLSAIAKTPDDRTDHRRSTSSVTPTRRR